MTRSPSEYLAFERVETVGRKTPIIVVRSLSSGTELGQVRWYGPWRQFCFHPACQTIFNVGCMTEIQNVIAELKAERA